jgi:large subunit ribosomal protein L23
MTLTQKTVLIRPRITERSSLGQSRGVYSFDVTTIATKISIKRAVEEKYKVHVVQVRTVPVPRKRVTGRKGRPGMTAGAKKAYVYLKEGEKIELA